LCDRSNSQQDLTAQEGRVRPQVVGKRTWWRGSIRWAPRCAYHRPGHDWRL